jgi:hypothetical protein
MQFIGRLVTGKHFYSKFEAGYIALQNHGNPVWYGNARARE